MYSSNMTLDAEARLQLREDRTALAEEA